LERVATMVHEFPRVPAVALLTEFGPRTPQTLLSLGTSGVRRLIDVRDPAGWRHLRAALFDECGNTVQQVAIAQLSRDLAGATDDCWRFFRTLFLTTPHVHTVRALAHELEVFPSTLMSRFYRAGVPAPKRYLAMARLVRAAHLFENRGLSIANVANHLEYSSPQSFGRHVRIMLRITAVDLREQYDGASMFQRFREELVLPHREALIRLAPLTHVTRRLRYRGPVRAAG
jgi:AraC-like DNA-binding protein